MSFTVTSNYDGNVGYLHAREDARGHNVWFWRPQQDPKFNPRRFESREAAQVAVDFFRRANRWRSKPSFHIEQLKEG